MLSSTVATMTAGLPPSHNGTLIIVAGTIFGGLGSPVAILMYGSYTGRLMSSGLSEGNTRPDP